MAEEVGHKNSTDHLRQVYGELGMVHGVVMGNRSLDPAYHSYPADLFHYCIGLDSALMGRGRGPSPTWRRGWRRTSSGGHAAG